MVKAAVPILPQLTALNLALVIKSFMFIRFWKLSSKSYLIDIFLKTSIFLKWRLQKYQSYLKDKDSENQQPTGGPAEGLVYGLVNLMQPACDCSRRYREKKQLFDGQVKQKERKQQKKAESK